MFWSAFKPGYCKAPWQTLGVSLSTGVPKCLIGYHWHLRLLASHRVGSLWGSQPRECVAYSCMVTWDPAVLCYPVKTSILCVEVQLPAKLENTHWLCSPTLNQWGSLVPLIVKIVSTLHGDTRFVRTKSCFKCILNLEFQESCVWFKLMQSTMFMNAKYNVLLLALSNCFVFCASSCFICLDVLVSSSVSSFIHACVFQGIFNRFIFC